MALAGLLAAALVVFLAAAFAAGPKTKRVSVKSNGSEVNADNDFPAISATGRFVSFESVGKFTKGDDGLDPDIFLHDRRTGKTTRMSVKSNGREAPGVGCEDSSMSSSGRFVAFLCDGALVNGDQNGYWDVYVHDRKTGKTTRASLDSQGHGVMANATNPDISANGRYVAFDSDGAFVPGDTNGVQDVYVHDRKTGKTKRVSIRDGGGQPTQDSDLPSISADGRYVAFQSYDDQMTADPDQPLYPQADHDIFVRDMKQRRTIRASLKANGQEADSSGGQTNVNPEISNNGRFVAFAADKYGVYVPGDTNNNYDVYEHDIQSGKNKLVSVKSNGTQDGLNGSGEGSQAPIAISGNGRFVAFESYSKLAAADANGERDVYLHDRKTGKTRLVSVKSNGGVITTGAGGQQLPAISADGSFVAFSTVGQVTGGDSGMDFDVFERGPLG